MAGIDNQQGLVRTIILIIILILVLSFIGFDIRGFVQSDIVQSNFSYIWGGVTVVWNNYLSEPILYFWNNIFVTLLWDSFISNLESIRAGEPHDFSSGDFIPTVGTSTDQ